MIDHQDSGYPILAKLYHTAGASNIGGNTQSNCGETWVSGMFYHPWQDAFFLQATAIALLARPGDADQTRIVDYFARGLDGRYNGTTGWPRGANTMLNTKIMDALGGPVYPSYSAMWAANRAAYWRCATPLPPDPATFTFNCGGSNYENNDYAGMSLAVIADPVTFAWLRASRDWLGAACRSVGCIDDALSFVQV
jgi:hypothetical protein